ncbi:MAG TPA: cyclic nucleotide-binding domain-containing protein [Acidimicrobiia bacterium]|nr:cyclic nucleotide-binding domain-containing protein [Acidimicrobiia bacterium]
MEGYELAIYAGYVARIPMFSHCDVGVLEHVTGRADVHVVAPGTEVVREGDVGEAMYLVADGQLRVTRAGAELAVIGQGDFFGELALLDPAPRDATVTAVTNATVVALDREAFRATLDEVPSLRDALLVGMARRLHALDRRF